MDFGSFLVDFWVFFGGFLGLSWAIFGSILGHFRSFLGINFESLLGEILSLLGLFLGQFSWVNFGCFLGDFGAVLEFFGPRDVTEAGSAQLDRLLVHHFGTSANQRRGLTSRAAAQPIRMQRVAAPARHWLSPSNSRDVTGSVSIPPISSEDATAIAPIG